MPFDQRLANRLVRRLVGTAVRPTHLTLIGLLCGVGSGLLFGFGVETDLAALLFMCAVFVDHADGELARLAGTTSRLGHLLDYLVGCANYTALFTGLGVGLYLDGAGIAMLCLGLAAGAANPIILAVRLRHERLSGAAAVAHPYLAGFELEDFIYLIGPITWLAGPEYFLVPFGLGTLGYLGWQIVLWRRGGPWFGAPAA